MNTIFINRVRNLQVIADRLPDPVQMYQMIGLAAFAFGLDTRSNNGHYFDHIEEVTRGTNTLFAHYSDEDRQLSSVVAVGHDLREDKARFFGGIDALDKVIFNGFGPKVLTEIRLLSNPEFPEDMPLEKRHEIYREHVLRVAFSGRISKGVKLADFLSNTTSIGRLKLEGNSEKAKRLAKKYLPLIPHFKEIATEYNLPGSTIVTLDNNQVTAQEVLGT